jgi:sugar lactone lactonase YvrE
MKTRYSILAVAALGAACDQSPEPPAAPAAPAAPTTGAPAAPAAAAGQGRTIVLDRTGFIPEGIEYDQTHKRFLSGSLAEGTIFELHEDGAVTPFVQDPELVSSVGIEVDEPRGRLLVANSDRRAFEAGNSGQAKLGVFNLDTGARLAMVDLAAAIEPRPDPARFFANDLTVDGDGNVYVTDSFTSAVYKVTADYQASVLHRFGDLPQGEQLNGIVYHQNGYLLVAADASLYKVPVANPAGASRVSIDQPVKGQDGIVWTADGRLAAVSNSADAPQVVAFASTDDWATARRAGVAKLAGQATTAAAVGPDIWAVHPHFGDAEPPSLEQAVFE